jgi:two-component system sensor histidine kinase KdpD
VRRSDELKTALLRSVSHDLRSPLTSIAAAGEALGSPRLDEEDREQLAADVVSGAQRLSDLVGKLLDVSRLQAGAADPHADWCDLEEIVRGAAEHVGAAPLIECGEEVPLVRVDAAQLERAIANLIENAQRHGGGVRSVFVARDGSGGEVTIDVVDFGPGMSDEQAARAFEPFVGTQEHSGAGLGLAIARGFVEANGGRLEHRVTAGGGSTFHVTIPVPVATAGEPPIAETAA